MNEDRFRLGTCLQWSTAHLISGFHEFPRTRFSGLLKGGRFGPSPPSFFVSNYNTKSKRIHNCTGVLGIPNTPEDLFGGLPWLAPSRSARYLENMRESQQECLPWVAPLVRVSCAVSVHDSVSRAVSAHKSCRECARVAPYECA